MRRRIEPVLHHVNSIFLRGEQFYFIIDCSCERPSGRFAAAKLGAGLTAQNQSKRYLCSLSWLVHRRLTLLIKIYHAIQSRHYLDLFARYSIWQHGPNLTLRTRLIDARSRNVLRDCAAFFQASPHLPTCIRIGSSLFHSPSTSQIHI